MNCFTGSTFSDATCAFGFTGNILGSPEFGQFKSSQGNSNPNLDDPIWGVKVNFSNDARTQTISFLSSRLPDYEGDVYGKGGNGPNFENLGNGTTGMSAINYVPTPDSVTTGVPEPGTYGLAGAGVIALLISRFRRS